MSRKLSKKIIIESIKYTHAKGDPLNSTIARKQLREVYYRAIKLFRSWRKAVEAAGIPYRAVAQRVLKGPRHSRSRDECIAAIREHYARGLPLQRSVANREVGWLVAASVEFFGTWDDALRAAGLDPSEIRGRPLMRSWSKKRIIQILKWRKKAGLPLNSESIAESDVGFVHAARSVFGSYAAALRAAGLDPLEVQIHNVRMTREEITSTLQGRHAAGLSINSEALADEKMHRLLGSIKGEFGTYRKAIEASGFDYDSIRKVKEWSRKKVIAQIRAIDTRGEPLNAGHIVVHYKDLHHAGENYFGSWRKAVETAGFDYDEIKRIARKKGCEKARLHRARSQK